MQLIKALTFLVLAVSTATVSKEVIGFAFSGAGAKIAQEAALAEALVTGKTPSGKALVPDIITGASSGSLMAVALNAILSKEVDYTWENYTSRLFSMTNGDVFDDTALGIAEIFTHNVEAGYILSTKPLRNLLTTMAAEWGFSTMGDLPIPTIISTVNKSSALPVRIRSDDPKYSSLPIVDVLMSSTAIPFVFPPQSIPGLSTEPIFVDGGTGVDNLPVIPLMSSTNPKVTEAYLVTHQLRIGQPTGVIKDIPLVTNAIFALDVVKATGITDGFNIGRDVSPKDCKMYQYVPVLSEVYFGLDFNTERAQFNSTWRFATSTNPVALN